MSFRIHKSISVVVVLPLLAGCTSLAGYSAKDAGFATVAEKAASSTGKQTVWVQNQEQAKHVSAQVQALLKSRKTISADTAVQIALLNNKGLQATYADLGDAAADVWQTALLPNPVISVGLNGIGTPGLEAFKSIEGAIASSLLALATQPQRQAVAETRFQKAELNAALQTLTLAAETRRAWINAVAAWETVGQLSRAQAAADAASELAQKLGETGALNKAGQARRHVFYAELAGETAKARLNARLAKEELTRLMGLWGDDLNYQVPNALPGLPRGLAKRNTIESAALKNRIDLQMAKLELEATARSHKLNEATRIVRDLDLVAGFETERENDHGSISSVTTGRAEIEFPIPIFDTGAARNRKAELAYMRAANLLAEKAVNVRSEARSAYEAYRSTYDIAVHYRNNVLPLRQQIEEQALLTYNGMISSTFEMLSDNQASVNSAILAVNAKRDFWLAEARIAAAIYGGGSSMSTGGDAPSGASADSGGGH